MSPWLLQFSPRCCRCSPGDSLDLSPRPGRGRGPFTAAVAWSGVVTGSSLGAALWNYRKGPARGNDYIHLNFLEIKHMVYWIRFRL